ncbi:MAG: hypothetical protein ACOX01_02580 [Methanobrevibacter boviskoreani]|jgi:hypothetical protein|uniref:hypothetical protein n=1 Tax=Methanobrevibacter boviskoreani TaxID=1348249 RepID=UPI0025844688|nr:hypothetical protein [uncultured Methanobrevibacter sp.]
METYAIEYIFNHIHRLYSENPKGDYGYIKIYLKSKMSIKTHIKDIVYDELDKGIIFIKYENSEEFGEFISTEDIIKIRHVSP